MRKHKPIVWSISGHDPSGGAGITADIKTLQCFGVESCALITANTVQNAEELVSVNPIPIDLLEKQFQALVEDKVPDALKIGMLANDEQIYWLIEKIDTLRNDNETLIVVYDPVAAASAGGAITEVTKDALLALFEAVDVVTPNMSEAEKLTGIYLAAVDDIAVKFNQMQVNRVIIKGGHTDDDECIDYAYQFDGSDTSPQKFAVKTDKVFTDYSHGGGCCYASSITALLSRGYLLRDAITLAKAFMYQGLKANEGRIQYYGSFEVTEFPTKPEIFPTICSPYIEHQCGNSRVNQLSFQSLELGGEKLGLYPVVDSIEWLEKLLPLGLNIIQLRVKHLEGNALEDYIARAIELARNTQTRLFINDYWQLAIKYNAYGVHLGQEDLAVADLGAIADAGIRLGISTHGCYEFLLAKQIQPSYLAIGAIFPTQTKDMTGQIQGVENLAHMLALAGDIPVVAIGGINIDTAERVANTGVDSIAVVTAITQAQNYAQNYESAVRSLKAIIEEAQ